MKECTSCQSDNIIKNEQGQMVCVSCAQVIGEIELENQVAFDEGHGIVGQVVDQYDNRDGRWKVSFERIVDDTLEYLYKELKVDEEYDEAFTKARKILLLAQTYKRVNKEKWQHLHIYVGAALYFGFRSKQAPYLLIDISDKLKECSVIKLARCYLKLLEFVRTDLDSSNPNSQERNELSQGLQFIDPSIYIPRFVKALEFKEKQKAIIETTKKLVKRMMVDWMSYGRRPSSLCGAALLISARVHGESLTTAEVCKVVLVCGETIRKRLAEFKFTPLAQLTVEQFDQIKDIETEVPGGFMDPPCYTRSKQKEAEIKEQDELRLKELTMKEAIKIDQIKTELGQQFELRQEDLQKSEIVKVEKDRQDELSELDEKETQEFILTQQESDQKKILWNSMYGEWVKKREQINQSKLRLMKVEGSDSCVRKRKQRVAHPLVNAPDTKTAVLQQFGSQINKQTLDDMFETTKKVKVPDFLVELQSLYQTDYDPKLIN